MIQDYGFRLYNPAIGKFLSVDPLFKGFPELTPYQFASNTPMQAIDLDGLEATIAITSRTVTLEFEKRVTAKGLLAAVNWLLKYKDGYYPAGFPGAEYAKPGGHAWLNLIRAQNVEVPNEVVAIHNKSDVLSGLIIMGIKDVDDSKNEVYSVFWGRMPGQPLVKEEKVLPNGFVVTPTCENCNGEPDIEGRRPVGPVKTIKGFKTTPGPGYIIDFFRKILGHKQGDKFFPEEIVPDVITTRDRIIHTSNDLYDKMEYNEAFEKTEPGQTTTINITNIQSYKVDSFRNGNDIRFNSSETLKRTVSGTKTFKKTKTKNGESFGPSR